MSITDSLDYLQPDFDLQRLTVPNLRNVLVKHDIGYSSNAARKQLLEIFQTQLIPQAKAILAADSGVTPSTKGIMSVPTAKDFGSQTKRKGISIEGGEPQSSPANCRSTHGGENGDDLLSVKRQRVSSSKPTEHRAQLPDTSERNRDQATISNEASSTEIPLSKSSSFERVCKI